MKKTFSFISARKTPERQADSIKHEVKKYIARERRKKLPTNMDYWDFDCKIGPEPKSAKKIHVNEINKSISELAKTEESSFYLEVLSKPAHRKETPKMPEVKKD
jgi:hypothetical protein